MESARDLYSRLLGPAWLQLAPPLRRAHTLPLICGRFRIAHGSGRGIRTLTTLLRLPRAASAAETRLVVRRDGSDELWQRIFDGRRLDTRQYRTPEGELGERLGILELRYCLEPSNRSLIFRQVSGSLVVGRLRLRLPSAWLPKIEACEEVSDEHHVGVHVAIVLPMLGPLMTYDGTIRVEDNDA